MKDDAGGGGLFLGALPRLRRVRNTRHYGTPNLTPNRSIRQILNRLAHAAALEYEKRERDRLLALSETLAAAGKSEADILDAIVSAQPRAGGRGIDHSDS